MTQTPVRQTLEVRDWHPQTKVNGTNSKGHWSVIRKRHDIDRDMAWASARQAGWMFVPGKVRLTITLVYPRKYRVDADNLVARCKGLIDGLKWLRGEIKNSSGVVLQTYSRRDGFFYDDSTDWLDLVVRAEVVPGQKATRLELEALA